jgi:N-acetylglucosamine-6-sulfatase
MTRTQAFVGAAILALAAGLAVGAREHGGSSAQAAPAATQRPNVLVLETDDQTLDEMAVLPNVRRLIGDQGVTFDHNFDSFSLCCPSRASFLTGQYSHNNGVRGNAPPNGGYQELDKSNTL